MMKTLSKQKSPQWLTPLGKVHNLIMQSWLDMEHRTDAIETQAYDIQDTLDKARDEISDLKDLIETLIEKIEAQENEI